MKTDKKKVNLSDVSSKYTSHQQKQEIKKQAALEKQQLRKERKETSTRSSPFLGTLIGVAGTVGAIATYIAEIPIAASIIIGFAGGLGALMCRGINDYDSISARICMGASIISLATATVILAIWLKGIGIWNIALNIM